MTRTFLTEKKEGDDGGGKIEWFQIKEDSNASWPQMICSFAQENEEADDSASEDDDNHEQLNEATEDVEQAEQSLDPGEKQHSKEKGKSTLEGKEQSDSVRKVHKEDQEHMDTDKVDSGTDKLSCKTEQVKALI
ncbi:unnamed protein product [Staurois parvus]|uniref:Uncharacterized protein n=1 Tax=Staurois parvus TaxID=386267 RepID=A0ABN9BHX1_9NEOB|nr:unnamed protein product [Staurois parvus]